MTTREYFQNVLDAHISAEMDAASAELMAKLDARNEKRKGADTKAKRESAERRAAVLDFLKSNEGAFTRDAIAEATGLTVGQVTAACKGLGDAVSKTEIKIEKAKKIAYSIA